MFSSFIVFVFSSFIVFVFSSFMIFDRLTSTDISWEIASTITPVRLFPSASGTVTKTVKLAVERTGSRDTDSDGTEFFLSDTFIGIFL